MRHYTMRTAAPVLLGLLLTVPGCASMGNVLTGRPDDLRGQVRAVDTRRGYLQISENYGRDLTVRYDGRTRVVYGNRNYSVSSLRRGDDVRVRVEYDRYDQPWADLIELRRDPRAGGSVWGNGGGIWGTERGAMRVERWNGVVQQVDYRGGWFVLERSRYQDARVYVGRSTRNEDIRRFERLRRGQRVQVEVRASSLGQAELVRFR